jgi:hypothetical protein
LAVGSLRFGRIVVAFGVLWQLKGFVWILLRGMLVDGFDSLSAVFNG